MKKFVGLFLGILLVLQVFQVRNVLATQCEEKILKMATNSTFPPYEYIKDGKIVGIDVEIAESLAKKLGYKLEIMDMEFNTIISSVESGKANIALAGMTITDERKKSVNFSTPYAKSVQVVIVKKDSPIKSLDELKGNKAGTQLGTTGDIYAKDDFGEEFVQSFDKYSDAVLALMSNKIDFVLVDEMTGKAMIKNNGDLKIIETPYADEEYAIAVTKDDPKLLEDINGALFELKKEGELDNILSKYIVGDQEGVKEKQGFVEQLKRNLIESDRWKYLAYGLLITLRVTFFSLLIGFFLGLLIALVKLIHKDFNPTWTNFSNIPLKIANLIASFYVSFIRGTPTMIQLLIMFNILLAGVKNLPLVAIATFGINSSAYMSEIFRGGFNGVNKGEVQGARALGLTYFQTFRKIVLPQSIKISLPALGNETITLLKETSIAGAIGLMELTRGSNIIISQTFTALIPYLVTALIYYLIVLALEKAFKIMERKMNYVKDK